MNTSKASYLIKAIEANKGLRFSKDYSDPNKLIDAGILVKTKGEIKLGYESDAISSIVSFFKYRTENSKLDSLEDYKKLVDEVDDYFRDQNITNGIWELTDKILAFALFDLHTRSKINLVEEILRYKSSDRFFFDINRALVCIISKVNLKDEEYFELFTHLLTEAQGDFAISSTIDIVSEFSANIERAKSLVNFIVINNNPQKVYLLAHLLKSISITDFGFSLRIVLEKLKHNEFINDCLNTLTNLKWVNSDDLNKVYTKVKARKLIDYSDEIVLSNLGIYFLSIISCEHSKTETVTFCFNDLYKLIDIKSFLVQRNILGNLSMIKGFKEEKLSLLKKIDNTNLNLKHIVNSVLNEIGDIDVFFEYVKIYSEQNKYFSFKADYFDYVISTLEDIDSKKFEERAISLMIEDKGYYRYAGLQIILRIFRDEDNPQFQIDLNTFNEESQYRIIAVLLSDPISIDKVISLSLPVRKSKYPLIVEVFKGLLEVLVWNYSSRVIKVLEENLNLTTKEDYTFYNEINKIYLDFCKYWDSKKSIKEFNPEYCQAKLFKEFNRKYLKSMQKSMGKSQNEYEENSWLKHVGKVSLVRGRGWRIEGNGKDFRPLGHFQTSFSFPREFFICPEEYEVASSHMLVQDWTRK